MPTEHAPSVVDRFLARAALRGEKVVALVRLLLCALFLGQYLFLSDALGRSTESNAYFVSIGAFSLGLVYSAWVLRGLADGPRLRTHLYIGVVMDALIITMALTSYVLYHPASYSGFLRESNLAIIVIGAITPGVRLVRTVAVLGASMMVLLYAGLLLLDRSVNGGVIQYGAADIVNFSFLLTGAALFGYTVASRTKRLVHEGAEAAVEAELARQRLGIYVSEEVAAEAMRNTTLQPGGERRMAAVLFSDLRGFTGYAERLSPEATVVELNAYLDAMVNVIREHGGLVDKFIGDAIMVVFGAAEPGDNDALSAVQTAHGMCQALAAHNRRRVSKGRPAFRHGIGVHYGPVVAGNIGNLERLQFTVIGDSVNLASRLESATKTAGAQVLISADAVDAARQGASGEDLPPMRSLGEIQVPGREASLEVHTLDLEPEEDA